MANGMHAVSRADYDQMIELFTTNMDSVMREVNNVQGLLTQTEWTGTNNVEFEKHMNTQGLEFHAYNDTEGNKLLDNIIAAMNDLAARLGEGPTFFPDANYTPPALENAAGQGSTNEDKIVSETALVTFSDQAAAGYDSVATAWTDFSEAVNGHAAWQGAAAEVAKETVRIGVPVIIGAPGGDAGGGDGVLGHKTSLTSYVDEQLTIIMDSPTGGGGTAVAS